MAVRVFLRQAHRVIAVLFLLSIIPAGHASTTGNETSPLVYIPLVFLRGRPWVQRLRARRT